MKRIKKFSLICLAVLCLTVFTIGGAKITGVMAQETNQASFNQVAHYEFRDKRNFGKDSLGNYDVDVGEGVTVNETIGGLTLGGLITARKIDGTSNDFSDLIDGSFSLSFRAYMSQSGAQNARFLCTGASAKAFAIIWRHSGFQILYSDGTTEKNATWGTNKTSAITTKGQYIFDDVASWYRITMIYDESNLSFRIIATADRAENPINYDVTKTFTGEANFGGFSNVFTIGGQTTGQSTQSVYNAVAQEKWPVLSDFRIYSGVIDQTEMQNIKTYDIENKWKLDEVEEPEEPEVLEGIAHYKFDDKTNLGKDSLGNHDLVVGSGVVYDDYNGGVVVGKSKGILYAPKIEGTDNDFSDTITGSFSVSMRVYICEVNSGGNYLVSTGSYSSNFRIEWASSGLSVGMGASQDVKFGTSSSAVGNTVLLNPSFAWYRITIIYNEKDMTLRLVAVEEGNPFYTYDYTKKLTAPAIFGGHKNTFTIGGQSNFGSSIIQYADGSVDDATFYPIISDFRLYKGVFGEEELTSIYQEDAQKYFTVKYNDGTNTLKEVKYLKTKTQSVYIPEKAGYEFLGWYANSNLSGAEVTDVTYSQSEVVTLYAKWESKTTTTSGTNKNLPTVETFSTQAPSNNQQQQTGCNGSLSGTIALLPLCFIGITLLKKKNK